MIAVLCWTMLFDGSLQILQSNSPDAHGAAAGLIPIHQLIDQRPGLHSGQHRRCCPDEEFLRRVSLDLTGMPPLAANARAFLNDSSADKRTRLIDQLLESPQHVRHLASTLDVMLMERRANTHVTQDEWLGWLVESIRQNKPWNVLVREILLADGDDPAQRAPARFYLDRGCEANTIARDLGRMFFGRDLQCAQCHDSPLVSDFLQADYQGLLAFAAPGYEVRKKHGDKEVSVYAERAGSDLAFESVFNRGTPHRTGARIPGSAALQEPFYIPGEEYTVAPADAIRSVPKFSRREMLAKLTTNGSNRFFNINIANRLWALMMGRGLVHPPDMIHPDNPAADPQLLEELGQRFADDGYDIRRFLREQALSDTYQRPFDLAEDAADMLMAQETAKLEPLTALQTELHEQRKTAVGRYETATAEFDKAEAAWLPVGAEYDSARNSCAEATKKLDTASAAKTTAEGALNARKSLLEVLRKASESSAVASQLTSADQELAAAVAALNSRLQQLTDELPAIRTKADEASAAAATASDEFNASRNNLEAVFARLQPLATSLQSAEQQVVESRAAMQSAQLRSASLEQQFRLGRRIVQLTAARQAIELAHQVLADSEAASAQAALDVTQNTAASAELAAAAEVARAQMTATAAAAAVAAQELRQLQAVGQKLTEIMTSLKNVQTLIDSDDAVKQLLTTLNLKNEAMNSALLRAQELMISTQMQHQTAVQSLTSAESALSQSVAAAEQLQQKAAGCREALAKAQMNLESRHSQYGEIFAALVMEWADRFQLANLKPLTPEQLCWTIFRVTTVYDRYAAAEQAELEQSSPLTKEQQNDPAVRRARAVEVEQRTFDKLKGNAATFVQFYGGGAGQPQGEFFASPDQALFAANGGSINSWVAPAGGNATERMIQAKSSREAAEELYLGILTRLPDEGEVEEVSVRLMQREDRSLAAQELVWGLLNSAEFRFNH